MFGMQTSGNRASSEACNASRLLFEFQVLNNYKKKSCLTSNWFPLQTMALCTSIQFGPVRTERSTELISQHELTSVA